MTIEQQTSFTLAQSSPEEGLDFACSLLSGGLVAEAESDPVKSHQLLTSLANYVQFRYVGELSLALDELFYLGQ